jgi:GSH-dependent disulfide-bond oxidoreductase
MIDLYFRPTSNGHKITIFLEETGLGYRLIPMESVEGGVFNPDFLRISPNNKMPVIVDHEPPDGGPPLSVFESGAILIYLAEKTGRFLPSEPRARAEALQWLMWQMAGLGPMSGQNGHFRHQAPAPADPYASGRYMREVSRLYTVLDHRLRDRSYVAGDYGIADMACHPWISTYQIQGMNLDDFPHLKRWWSQVGDRPALQRAYGQARYEPSARLDEAAHKARYQQTAEMLRAAYARMDGNLEGISK